LAVICPQPIKAALKAIPGCYIVDAPAPWQKDFAARSDAM
jgi:hypothetical protein